MDDTGACVRAQRKSWNRFVFIFYIIYVAHAYVHTMTTKKKQQNSTAWWTPFEKPCTHTICTEFRGFSARKSSGTLDVLKSRKSRWFPMIRLSAFAFHLNLRIQFDFEPKRKIPLFSHACVIGFRKCHKNLFLWKQLRFYYLLNYILSNERQCSTNLMFEIHRRNQNASLINWS